MSLGIGNSVFTNQKKETSGTSNTQRYLYKGIVGISPELVAGTNTLTAAVLIGKDVVQYSVDNIDENSQDAHAVGGNYPAFSFNSATGTITRLVSDVSAVDNPWINGQVVIIP